MTNFDKTKYNDYEKLKELVSKLGDGTDIFNDTEKVMKTYEKLKNDNYNYEKVIEGMCFNKNSQSETKNNENTNVRIK